MKTFLKNMAWGLSLMVIGLSSACTGTPINFPTAQNPPLDLQQGRSIEAEACGFQLLLLIPIAVNGRQERAFQSLQMQTGDNYLTDVRIQERWIYALVGTAYCTKLNAMAYPRKAAD